MPTVTVNISDRGTALAEGGSSKVGHMWFEINAGDGTPPESFGFAPATHGQGFGEGKVYTNDSSNYQSKVYTKTVDITEVQYIQLRDFGVNPAENGFSTYYNGLANSCIDFTWGALALAGIDSSGFQGGIWPTWNINRVDTVLQQLANGGIGATSPPPSPLRTFSTLDAQGRVIESSVQNGPGRTLYRKEYIYDQDGQGVTVRESVVVAGQNRIAKEVQYQIGQDAASAQLTIKYYDVTRPNELVDQQTVTYQPDGSVAMVRQDGRGRVYQIDTQTVDGSGTTTRTTTKYDKDSGNWTDQTTTIQNADGGSTATTVTPEGASTTVTKDKNDQTIQVETDVSDGNGGRIRNKLNLDADGNLRKQTETRTDADGNSQTETKEYTPPPVDDAKEQTEASPEAQTRRDPLILDLDGNGIATTKATTSAIHFDHDANGFAESTGWLNPDDAFLAFDRNGNGAIDSGLELFGDQTTLRSGAKASSGLQALAEWDTTKDGKIDAQDARFADLRAWTDTNQDGISQATELQALTEAGVSSISLAGTATNAAADTNGNTLTRSGSFTRLDGSTGLAGELLFQRDTTLSIPVTNYTVTDTIAAQPDLSGYGNLLDLHQALAQEVGAGGTALAAALAAYQSATTPAARDSALDTLLYTWANAQGLSPTSRGGAMDARKIAFLETAFGQSLGNPDSNTAVQWNMSWQQVREYYGASLLAQTSLKPLFDEIQYAWDEQSQTLKADLSSVESLLQDRLAADPVAGTAQLADFARAIKGLGAQDSVNYLALRETFIEQDQQNGTELAWAMDSAGMKVYDHRNMGQRLWSPHIEGTDGSEAVRGSLYEGDGYLNSLYGHDTIWGTTRSETLINEVGSSLLYGAGGNDRLWAGDGDDTLDGGTGNDTLQGEAGNDTYIFRKGSGVDRIQGWNAGDRVWLAANAEHVAFKRSRNDLVIGFTDATDKLVLENFYAIGGTSTSSDTLIAFRDGSTWNNAALNAWFATPARAGAGSDIINGSANADTLQGLGGNDQIAGNGGTDVIEGGAGADRLIGAADYDAYNDRLTPMMRANGDDTYVFRRGDGQDTIADLDPTQNTDTLKLVGIASGELSVSIANERSEIVGGIWTQVADILIDLGQGESVTLQKALSRSGVAPGKIERIEFDDGTVWSDADLRARLQTGSDGNDFIQGWGDGDAIDGGAGNDYLNGGGGDDSLQGGEGNDWLDGGQGNDVLSGGDGSDYLSDATGDNVLNGNAGDDSLYGGKGNDVLDGGSGGDTLIAGAGNDTLFGGDGNDRLVGELGDDLIDGGAGDDLLTGGAEQLLWPSNWVSNAPNGNDTYVFGRGHGHDIVNDRDRSAGNVDTIRLADDILPDQVQLAHVGNNLVVSLDTGDTLTVTNWFKDGSREWRVEQIVFGDGTLWNEDAIIDRAPLLGTSGNDTLIGLDGHDNVVYGLDGNDAIYGRGGNDTLQGDEGQDQIDGGSGDDLLLGGAGRDTLTGGAGSDVLEGGTGDDTLIGDLAWTSSYSAPVAGDDVYRFARGDGRDTVIETAGGNDRVEFGADIAVGDITVRHVGQDIVLSGDGGADSVTLRNWASGGGALVETVSFNDGTTWDTTELKRRSLIGGSAADALMGYEGDDTLTGNQGNDILAGGAEDDTYVFRAGDGQDTVVDDRGSDRLLFTDLESDAASVLRRNNDLLVAAASGDTVTVRNWFVDGVEEGVNRVEFADGVAWDAAELRRRALIGTDAADVLTAYATDDVLVGGKGDDLLYGGQGNDTYVFHRGDGRDTVIDRDGTAGNVDTLRLADLTAGEVTLAIDGYDLLVQVTGTEDQVRVPNWFDSAAARVEQIIFADGEAWDTATIQSLATPATSGDDFIMGLETDDSLDGGAGNDTIYGMDGNDVLTGGRDDDKLYGGYGTNEYRIGRGEGFDEIFTQPGSPDATNYSRELRFAAQQLAEIDRGPVFQSDYWVAEADARLLGLLSPTLAQALQAINEGVPIADATAAIGEFFAAPETLAFQQDYAVAQSQIEELDLLEADAIYATGYWATAVESGLWSLLGDELKQGLTAMRDGVTAAEARATLTDMVNSGEAGSYWDEIYAAESQQEAIATLAADVDNYQSDVWSMLDSNLLWQLPDELRNRLQAINAGVTRQEAHQAVSDLLDWGHGASDTLVLGPGITQSDLSIQYKPLTYERGYEWLSPVPGRLAIGWGNNEGVLLQVDEDGLGGHYGGDGDLGIPTIGVRRVRFADGSELTLDELIARADGGLPGAQTGERWLDNALRGSVAKDTIFGGEYADVIDARDQADTVFGDHGDDIIAGGKGADTVEGGGGNDVYVYNRGDGADVVDNTSDYGFNGDTISFGGGIRPADVTGYFNSEGDLVLLDGASGGAVTIRGSMAYAQFIDISGSYQQFNLTELVDQFAGELSGASSEAPFALFDDVEEFAVLPDGAKGGDRALAYAQIGDLFAQPLAFDLDEADDVIEGSTLSDVIYAGDGDNVISAGAGNDRITAGEGNDTVDAGSGDDVIDAGDGNDAIVAGDGNDVIVIAGDGVKQVAGGAGDDTYYFQRGAHLVIDDKALPGEGNRLVFDPDTIEPDEMHISIEGRQLVLRVGEDGEGGEVRFTNFDPANPEASESVSRIVVEGEEFDWSWLVDRGIDVIGTEGDDIAVGGAGDDRISGLGGSDVIVGVYGDDLLDGGDGDDTYVFNIGDGADTIIDSASVSAGNMVRFGADISVADLELSIAYDDEADDGTSIVTVLIGEEGNDSLSFNELWRDDLGGATPVAAFHFADGTVMTWNEVMDFGFSFVGDQGDSNYLEGTDRNDSFFAAGDENTLLGGAGDDTYWINPSSSWNTIVDDNAVGAGNTVHFGDGMHLEDAELEWHGGWSLVLDGEQQIDLRSTQVWNEESDADSSVYDRVVDNFVFADGTSVDFNDLLARGVYIHNWGDANGVISGTPWKDIISGTEEDDLISGGTGDDTLHGFEGDDTYVFNRGDGKVTINDVSSMEEGNTLRFGEGITLDDIVRSLRFKAPEGDTPGEFIIRLGDSGDEVHITGFDPEDPELGAHGVESFAFADGAVISFRQMIRNTFVVQGGADDDSLSGTALGDRLYGYEGNDELAGNGGDDALTGGTGDDILSGDAGNDVYILDLGSGNDTVFDSTLAAAENLLVFGVGITRVNLSFEVETGGLRVRYSPDDSVLLQGWSPADGEEVVHAFEFADGSQESLASLLNSAPVIALTPTDVIAVEDAAFTWTVPAGTFADPDFGDVLTYTVTGASGTPLPEWVSFDAGSLTLSGSARNEDVGSFVAEVTASDRYGKHATASFTVLVDNTNDAPEVALALADQQALEDAPFAFTVPQGAFRDVDAGDALTFTATLADGSALPSWLAFDALTGTLTGMPTNDYVGSLAVKVTATDGSGATASQVFELDVVNTNDAPEANGVIAATVAMEDGAFAFAVPATAFRDVDVGDTLTLSASLANGDSLPAWLSFDAVTGSFSGTPLNGDVGALSVAVIATDATGASASQIFALSVINTNDAPEAVDTIAAVAAIEDSAFAFTISAMAFRDIDVGDSLTLSASLANGDSLPTWLSFDAATGTFSGTPLNDDVAALSVVVTATDAVGESASQTFALDVANTNDAPTVGTAISAAQAIEDAAFQFAIPANAFADVDLGDALTLSASLTNGDPLPAWLAFDALTGLFSGTPTNDSVGSLGVKVTAIDSAGASVSQVFALNVGNTNDVPEVGDGITAVVTMEDSAFAFTIPATAFTDIDVGDALILSASLANGDSLPAWLSFDVATGSFSGTPLNEDVGSLSVAITATDASGVSASQTFALNVTNTNDAPMVGNLIPTAQATEDSAFGVAIPTTAFHDVDVGDAMSYGATLANGDPLPAWLSFDAATGTFSGTPLNGDVESLSVVVTATDAAGASASQTFALNVANTNDAPMVGTAIPTVQATEDSAFGFVIPTTAFHDMDVGDALSYGATLVNGDPLPTWLSFDAAAGTFSGTPLNEDVGALAVAVTATDASGVSASQTFVLDVANTNDVPIVGTAIPAVQATEDSAFGFVVPATAFRDVDVGDTLRYSAKLDNGDSLPAWLTFDAATGTFSGTPLNDDVGTLSIAVVATDLSGASGRQTFALSVVNTNDTPVAADVIGSVSAMEDAAFQFVVPDTAFHDVDIGDHLGYRATLANSDPLPAWLAFDLATRTFSGTPTNDSVGRVGVTLTATDGSGAEATQTFDLSVINTNDTPVTAGDAGAVVEDLSGLASGNVLTNDRDPDVGDVLTVADAGVHQGSYGQLSLAASGAWTYQLDATKAQALGAGETAVEHFAYAAYDGQITAPGVLDISVGGSNDAPVLAASLSAVSVNAGSILSWSLPSDAFVDPDAHDLLGYSASLADGSSLPSWLRFDELTGSLEGTPGLADVGEVSVKLTATDGSGATAVGMMALTVASLASEGQLFVGTPDADTLTGTGYNDVFDGRAGADVLIGLDGDDLYLVTDKKDRIVEQAGGGFDTVWADSDKFTLPDQVEGLAFVGRADYAGNGNGLNNLLAGNRGDNRLDGKAGDDILLGLAGEDTLLGGAGRDALDGGSGDDVLEDGDGGGIVAGGRGNDTIRLGAGADVIAFNRGDGADRVQGGDGQNDVLSIGGGIRVTDIRLRKSGKDLVVSTGSGDSLQFVDWYKSAASKTISTLQVATGSGGTQFERYDFGALVQKFDSVLAANCRIDSWMPGSDVSRFKLGNATSDVAGGSLAAAYASKGDLSGIRPEEVSVALATPRSDAAATSPLPDVPLPPQPSCHGGDGQHGDHDGHGQDDRQDHDGHFGWKSDSGPFLTQREVEAAWQSWRHPGTSTPSGSPIDYAMGWARLRDRLAGRMDEGDWGGAWCDRAGGIRQDGCSLASSGPGGFASGNPIGLPGTLLKPFEGLKEGFNRLHGS